MVYIAEFGKMYGTVEEFNFRKNLFEETHADITEHNATNSNFELGHNLFSDWTADEYKRLMGYRAELQEETPEYTVLEEP